MRDNNSAAKPVRVGIFHTVKDAHHVVQDLMNAGFTHDDITVICSDETKERYFREFEHQQPAGAHTPGAIAAGGAIGATVTGISMAAAVAATGGTALIALAPLMMGTGGVVGGLVGAMMTRGVEKEVANFYDQAVIEGKILVSVEYHGPDETERLATAAKILAKNGAKPLPMTEG